MKTGDTIIISGQTGILIYQDNKTALIQTPDKVLKCWAKEINQTEK